MNDDEIIDGNKGLQRLKEFGRKLFGVAKKDIERAEEFIDEAIEPTEKPSADE